jgi:predicted translin family RNA/ssDNA-binding protein
MEGFFDKFNDALESQSQVKEDIQKEVRELQNCQRKIQFALQKAHKEPADQKTLEQIAQTTSTMFASMKPHWDGIVKQIGNEHPERYHHLWKFVMGDLVFLASYKHWLETQKLLGKEEATAMILGRANQSKGSESKSKSDNKDRSSNSLPTTAGGYQIEIDLEDYLAGLSSLPRELSRLCVNCVRCANYATPQAISKFVLDLYSGFRLLNLRNDGLRRKFDAIKYDVTRLEEVMYDLSVRKLGTQAGSSAGIGASTAAQERDSNNSNASLRQDDDALMKS